MRVLIAPMAAMAETSGPYSRAAALCRELVERGHEPAFCAAEDVNYRPIENVRNYYSPIPTPFGAPMFIGKRIFRMAQALGIQAKKKVESFEQVLFFAGATAKGHFAKDVSCIQAAIRDFRPDVVYAEFRIAAIVAARLENVRCATGYSYPVQTSHAQSPQFSQCVRTFLKEKGLPPVVSALELFDWADIKIVPSSYELEPITGDDVVFTGPFSLPNKKTPASVKDHIMAYMGTGTITPDRLISTLADAFRNTNYKLFIASAKAKPFQNGNMHVAPRFDFGELMPKAAAYINHGGQNSLMTGLIYGVPQIICPGNVFERQYNAASAVKLGAAIQLQSDEFNSENVRNAFNTFTSNLTYAQNAQKAGDQLISLGGVRKAADAILALK